MRAVILDVDGTLIQSMAVDCELYVASIRAVLGSVQFRPSFGDYENVTDSGILAQVFEDNSLALDAGATNSIKTHFCASLDHHIQRSGPFPEVRGAAKFVDRLKRSDSIDVAIATGGWRESAILKLGSSGFDLDDIPLATCDDSPSRTEILRAALSKLGHKIESITYIGDAEWDRLACQELGWNFVAVGPELGGIKHFDDMSF